MVKTMAKMGRPKTSERDDVSIKFDRKVSDRAQVVARARGISRAEYLSEMCRAQVDRDLAKLAKDLGPSE